jgi:hypothetical protein
MLASRLRLHCLPAGGCPAISSAFAVNDMFQCTCLAFRGRMRSSPQLVIGFVHQNSLSFWQILCIYFCCSFDFVGGLARILRNMIPLCMVACAHQPALTFGAESHSIFPRSCAFATIRRSFRADRNCKGRVALVAEQKW